MKYFTINELCKSSTATQRGIDNTPNQKVIHNLKALTDNILDPLREKYGKPIRVNSGYRCDALNKVVGGSKTSQHCQGLAADITVGSPDENKIIFGMIIAMNLPYDQIIDEKDFDWVHVSYSDNPRRQILHL